jgi:metal-responsive CopG/Arc/MetJ family transcriptional regulator
LGKGGHLMNKSDLKNRKRFTNTLDNKLKEQFDELSKETRIPKSRLLDEAIEDLLKKYGKNNKQTKK